ncbi:MAG: RsmB/NOP family class I SAM-dependent RNA methyltransferase [Opitutaceae bacterium]|jgi:16S rRNA (cytosine967-C5)-methyltransferase
MSIVHSQKHTFLRLLAELRPLMRKEAGLPARIEAILRRERGLGSRDRRLYRELFYTFLRYLPWLENGTDDMIVSRVAALCAELPATRPFREAWANAAGLDGLEKTALLPEWFKAECPEAFEEPLLGVLLSRAPLWLRVQTDDDGEIQREFSGLGRTLERSDVLPCALRMRMEADVTRTASYEQGAFEIQDLGSQMILEACGIEPGARWLDACAGAGGKTLQLARLLGPEGQIDAQDIRPAALEELAHRAARAGAKVDAADGVLPRNRMPPATSSRGVMAEIHLRGEPVGTYDGVLVDAPCSGTGTWRRFPHLKWTTMHKTVARLARLQTELLARFSASVRPGGRLIYATCSLCRSENEAIVASFLETHRDFSLRPFKHVFRLKPRDGTLTVSPSAHDTDGYFVASMERAG